MLTIMVVMLLMVMIKINNDDNNFDDYQYNYYEIIIIILEPLQQLTYNLCMNTLPGGSCGLEVIILLLRTLCRLELGLTSMTPS